MHFEENFAPHEHSLPPEFTDGVSFNNIAFSRDLSKYLIIDDSGSFTMREVPRSGVLEIDGRRFTLEDNDVVRVEHVALTRSNRLFQDSLLSVPVSRLFHETQAIYAQGATADIEVRVHDKNSIEVEGVAAREPEVRGEFLDLGLFSGVITLPSAGVEAAIETRDGAIRGEIGCEGRLSTIGGEISVRLVGPRRIEAISAVGCVTANNLLEIDTGTFVRRGDLPTGVLRIDSLTGNIHLEG